jgi:class 3 adenylate cyclase
VSADEQIMTWLDGIGLAQYAAVFVENAVDFEILPDVTEADLEKLGVALGHRKRILRAIAALPAASLVPIRSTSAQSKAERRQVTVLFCDLVGSTALAVRLDPKDLREVIRAFQDSCAAAITHMGGYVARFMGGQADDGIKRGAKLMAHAGDELRLVLACQLELTVLILDFVEQPHVLDGNRRLVGEGRY